MINLPARYAKVLDKFTTGGMADTLLCEDANLRRQVVIKSLKAGIEPHRLIDELSALSAIRSKYVVQVLDVIIDAGQPVGFVEEYLPGSSLTPCDPSVAIADAIKTLYPIAAGIADIHSHGRVHRDIKPDNMRYDAEGYLKIFDFGLAKINTSPGTKVLYFSEGFAAPESFQKDSSGLHNFDYPIDVYAFGCVALWLLNGGALYPEMKGIPPQIPSSLSFDNLPIKIDSVSASILLDCLNSDPSKRPSMAQCRDHFAAELLRDRHKMMLTRGASEYVLDSNNRSVNIKANGCAISVIYNGLSFAITSVSGDVCINNRVAQVGQTLSGSTVIVMRKSGSIRPVSVTCDVSHPEVIL